MKEKWKANNTWKNFHFYSFSSVSNFFSNVIFEYENLFFSIVFLAAPGPKVSISQILTGEQPKLKRALFLNAWIIF